jgi:hypothetical protein
MIPRYVLISVALLYSSTAFAQLTITHSNFPLPQGTFQYISHQTDEADESVAEANAAAIAALIARSGVAQTWDFRTIEFTQHHSGEATSTAGATGPGAGDALLSQASHTYHTPFVEVWEDEEEGEHFTLTGDVYTYLRVTSDDARSLGFHMEGEMEWEGEEPEAFVTTSRNTPDGAVTAVFPLTYGTSWTTTYEQESDFFGFLISSNVSATNVVDGWGTLIGPGMTTGVPALRVKVTTVTSMTLFPGLPPIVSEMESYEFRTISGVDATLFVGESDEMASATFSIIATGGTSTDADAPSHASLLSAAYPNPFVHTSAFEVAMAESGHLRVTVHDVLGREVMRLADEAWPAGRHTLTLDGSTLSSGLYVVRVQAGLHAQSIQVSIVR